jgi:hypothetical protein
VAFGLVILKYLFHAQGWELVQQSSLHNGVISSAIFVLGFILSATISDYKESERIPSDLAANLEDMFDDAAAIHASYPVFDLNKFRKQLSKIAHGFDQDARHRSYNTGTDIRALATFFSQMEVRKVPPNFIVKLKQQQTSLLRSRHRVNYIQRIKFIPSATILARAITSMVLILLLATNIDPFYGGLVVMGIISFVLVYILLLISVISTPFHASGKTQDDVSLFLVKEAADYLSRKR